MRLPGIFLVLCASLSIGCTEGAQVPELGSEREPIINGEACSAEQEPQAAALIIDAIFDFGGGPTPIRTLVCTATLIAPDVALTAAHCIDPTALTGGFGTITDLKYYLTFEADLSRLTNMETVPSLPADARLVRSVVKHEQFSLETEGLSEGLSNFYDIGLVFLDDVVTGIEPAIVITPEEAQSLAVGNEVSIAGWGRRTAEESDAIGVKHCARAQIYELGEYEMQIGNEPDTSRKCHGDSGGPTFIEIVSDSKRKSRVIGATSRAYDASDCNRGGIDTMPSAWYAWIDGHMSAQCDAGTRAWCDVAGVIEPSFYDEEVEEEEQGGSDEEGGCSFAGPGAAPGSILLLALCMLGLRRRQPRATRPAPLA